MRTDFSSTTFRPTDQISTRGPEFGGAQFEGAQVGGAEFGGAQFGGAQFRGRAPLRGRAQAIVVCAVMGFAWAMSASANQNSALALPVRVGSIVVAVVLLVGARRLRGVADQFGPTVRDAGVSKSRSHFHLVIGAEIAAVALTVMILARTGHEQWIPAGICAVVGLHFLPLARTFSMPSYYATGAALCLVTVATVVAAALGAPASVWHLVPGLGAAICLWATGAAVVVASRAALAPRSAR
jgi:hypothetical protein